MSYIYEGLGDERFQQLCQAILTTTHQDVQCLPVGQPDGGRDAMVRLNSKKMRVGATVFQVKFSKNPSSKDERTVIEELIKSESSKVRKLISRGMQAYYVLTNVSGTSHPDIGTIDKVNATLSAAFGIPSFCWWRDDLDRRIDANASIKWSYPDILRGTDVLQALYEGLFVREQPRRLNAIRAYLAYQHKYDSQLKFKQVDLEKGIIELFVDVPAAAVGPAEPREREKWREKFLQNGMLAALVDDARQRFDREDGDRRIGAVEALSNMNVANALPRIVVEGAPGQGKSTVTQFLCQVHRILLLKQDGELGKISAELRPTSVRLPLRVDLRDYATWLSGRSPFQESSSVTAIGQFSPALESFLAAQISAQSGGLQFSSDDLLEVAAKSALLIVLDGFDEVADIATRNRLVKEVSDASTRFAANTISYQIIVTSRPAAFANSPGFSRDDWQHIQILSLTKPIILAYAEKWLSGHNLDKRDRNDITTVLKEKLEYPHVRDLARNPMQLAILLALISTQGTSLPDKRTTLYDRYIDIFFNRESEKSKVVRDKRELLIDMHRYLAWKLQVEVESDAKAGNVSEKKLRELLRAYLTGLGHDPSLVDALFVGMVERVVALVSRVQGTFEFEVQPLREYFAARYLYDTAPYIQAGSSRTGSIMDRFDALARNAYWLNVTRFYCGCYSTGQLPSLVDGLISIGSSEQYRGTSYIIGLGMTLLGDYVFNLQPISVSRLADFLLNTENFRILLASRYSDERDEGLTLPENSGGKRLLAAAANAFKKAKTFDTAYASSVLIRKNATSDDISAIWTEAKASMSKSNVLPFGNLLGVVRDIPVDELVSLIESGGFFALRTSFYNNRFDVFTAKPEFWKQLIFAGLDGHVSIVGGPPIRVEDMAERVNAITAVTFLNIVSLLASLDSSDRFKSGTFHDLSRRYLREYHGLSQRTSKESGPSKVRPSIPISERLLSMARKISGLELAKSADNLMEIASFLNLLSDEVGYRCLAIDAAVAVLDWWDLADILPETDGVFSELFVLRPNSSKELAWSGILADACGGKRVLVVLKAFVAWASSTEVVENIELASQLADSLTAEDFKAFYATASRRYLPYPSRPSDPIRPRFADGQLERVLGDRFGAIILSRLDETAQDQVFSEVLLKYTGLDLDILDARVSAAWKYSARHPTTWQNTIRIVAETYEKGVSLDNVRGMHPDKLPMLEARTICQSPNLFPLPILIVAEQLIYEEFGAQAIAVGKVAAREQWFSDVEHSPTIT